MVSSLWMLLSAFLFAVLGAFVQLGTPDMGTMGIVCYRGIFAVTLIAVWAKATGRTLGTRYLKQHLIRSLLGVSAMALWLYSLAALPLGTGMTLHYTTPLFMAAGAMIFSVIRHQPWEWKLGLCSLIGFGGVSMVMQPEFSADQIVAAIAGLAGALIAALVGFQIRKLAELKEPSWRVVYYFSWICIVVGFAGHAGFEKDLHVDMNTVWYALGIGFAATFAQLAVTKAYGKGNIVLSAIMQYFGIIFGALIGALLYGDVVSLRSAIGMLIIIAAGVFASLTMKKAKPQKVKGEVNEKITADHD